MQEWCGETAKGGRFIVPFAPSSALRPNNSQEVLPFFPQQLVPEGVGPGFPPRQACGTSVELLDMRRVEAALATLHEEEDIADAMAGKPPRDRTKDLRVRSPPGTTSGAGCGHVGETGAVASAGLANGRPRDAASSGSPASTTSAGGLVDSRDVHAAAVVADNNRHATAAAAAAAAAATTAGAAPVGVTSKKRRMRDVLAVYRHRGAQLVLQQTRKRHPFRMDGVFCRQDRGEWAGQVKLASSTCRDDDHKCGRAFATVEHPRQAKLLRFLDQVRLHEEGMLLAWGVRNLFPPETLCFCMSWNPQLLLRKSLVGWPIAPSQLGSGALTRSGMGVLPTLPQAIDSLVDDHDSVRVVEGENFSRKL